MGKFTYLRSRYYVPYEYSYFIKRKNKNIYKYLLFKLIANILEEMFFSVKAYKLAIKKIKFISRINLRSLVIIRFFIYKFFNFIFYSDIKFRSKSLFYILNELRKRMPSVYKYLPYKIRTNINSSYKTISNLSTFKKNNSSYVLFIRLLLLLMFRRNTVLFNFMYTRSIKYYIKKISNYIFFERYNKILLNINESILNFDLRKLILTSIFKIRKYAKRHQFLNKKPILNKISFLIILNTKRFDKLNRPKHNPTFYSYKLQFRQIYKNIYNFKTTKKFNKYIKYVNSKLMHNISIMQFYFVQIANIINYVFQNNEIMKWNIPVNINNILNYSNNYYFFSIGDKIEIIYEYYKHIILIRRLYIVYLISLIFFNCSLNIIKNINYKFNNIDKNIAMSNTYNNRNLSQINISKNYLRLNSLISFFRRTNIVDITNNINFKNILISNNLKKNLFNQVCSNNYSNIPIKIFKQLFKLNKNLVQKIKHKKNFQYKKFQLLKKYYNNNIQILFKLYLIYSKYIYQKTINYKQKMNNSKKFKPLIKYIRLYKRYLRISNNILYIHLCCKLASKIINIKHIINNFSTKIINYNFLLKHTYKLYNKKYFYKHLNKRFTSTFYNNNNYYIINSNENSIRTNINSNYFANLYIFTPLINIYKYYLKTLTFNTAQNTFYLINVHNLLNNYLNSHYMYMLALYYHDNNICLDFQINFTIIKQITSNLYKNYIISLFIKSYNSIQSSYFKPNSKTESKIKTFLLHTIGLNKPHLIGIKNSLFNSSYRYNLNINNNINLIRISEVSNFFNIFVKYNLLFQMYNWLCDHLILSILDVIKKKKLFNYATKWKLQQFYTQLYSHKLQLFIKSNKISHKQYKKFLFKKALSSFKIFFTINSMFKKKIFFSPYDHYKDRNIIDKEASDTSIFLHDKTLEDELFQTNRNNLKLNLVNLEKLDLPNFESIINSYNLTKFKNVSYILNKINTFVMHETMRKTYGKDNLGISILDMIRILNYKYATKNNIKEIYLNKFLIFRPKFKLFVKQLNYVKNNNINKVHSNNYTSNRFYHNNVSTIKPKINYSQEKRNMYNRNRPVDYPQEKRNMYNRNRSVDYLNISIKKNFFKKNSKRSYKSNFNFKSFIKKFNEITINKKFKWTQNKQIQFNKNQIFEKLYFEYINNIDYCPNIKNTIKLFEIHKLLINQSYFIEKIKNISLNSIYHKEKNIIKNYYHGIYSSMPIKKNKIRIFKQIISNFKNIKNNYRFNNLLKKSITNHYSFYPYNTKLVNIIPLYIYLKYIKSCLTRFITMPIYTKLFEHINTEFIHKLKNIINVKTYLHNRSKYFESINFIYNYNSNKYVLENNKLILYSNSNLKTNYRNLFVEINLETISTDLRYLFDEKNYISLLSKYR